jgi:hypothetical protein
MLTRPTTEQVLRGIVGDLNEQVLPELADGPAKVTVQMITQLLSGCATRAAHEIAWMTEEIEAITAAVDGDPDPATADALAALRAAPAGSWHLDDVAHRYHLASEALAAAIEAAYGSGAVARAAELRGLLLARSAHEMAIVGALDLVGRG